MHGRCGRGHAKPTAGLGLFTPAQLQQGAPAPPKAGGPGRGLLQGSEGSLSCGPEVQVPGCIRSLQRGRGTWGVGSSTSACRCSPHCVHHDPALRSGLLVPRLRPWLGSSGHSPGAVCSSTQFGSARAAGGAVSRSVLSHTVEAYIQPWQRMRCHCERLVHGGHGSSPVPHFPPARSGSPWLMLLLCWMA